MNTLMHSANSLGRLDFTASVTTISDESLFSKLKTVSVSQR